MRHSDRTAYRSAVRFYRYRHALGILAVTGAVSPVLVAAGALLHLIGGRLLAPFGQVHECLDFLAGEPLMTHQLPRVAEEAAPVVLAAHPALVDVVVPADVDSQEAVMAFLQVAQHNGLPAGVDLEPMPREAHASIDPMSELQAMASGKPIIGIVVDPEGPDAS